VEGLGIDLVADQLTDIYDTAAEMHRSGRDEARRS
jgi:hypothetical protein